MPRQKRRQPVLPTFSYSAEMNVPNYVPARNKKLTPSLFFIICLFVLRKQKLRLVGAISSITERSSNQCTEIPTRTKRPKFSASSAITNSAVANEKANCNGKRCGAKQEKSPELAQYCLS